MKKLKLNKQIISLLNDDLMEKINGGVGTKGGAPCNGTLSCHSDDCSKKAGCSNFTRYQYCG